ncbi:TetR/AcrR family transcriptional regulator [Paracraurococcus lichenis]|uniref:TetR/AcrR family transcriptional regulator n=1 Tax=Paracraurococcus lichenis TaxID=3064888 RepID=A0ABT9E4C5_9PROT|nr:TetR/AcrR family transcriptional regulator [Paracraurococcus sp. LOR1-02]MDO9711007.1 TetR/AcrR family transcriptional regulator [Paracraurococcus sp. LOR1-02]
MPDTAPALRPRQRDPEQTRRAILDAALAEFADKGLSGARVDEIAARTATTKRMIYYYFGSKEGLYAAVLEEMYGGIRDAEQALELDSLDPVAAMTRLVEVTFDYHAAHPAFVRLVAVENIHQARHLRESPSISDRNDAVIRMLRALLDRGERAGVFRARVDAVDLHLLISGFCFYRVSNRHTLQAIFGRDLTAPAHAAAHRRMIVEAVLAWLRPG